MDTNVTTRAQGLGELWPLSGAHIIHLYLNETERRHALLDFIAVGIARGERLCVIHDRPIQEFIAGLGLEASMAASGPAALPCSCPPRGPDVGPAVAAGQFVEDTSRNFYLSGGVFDHDRIYRKWHEFYKETQLAGFPSYRGFGEVLPELEQVANGQAVVLYEMNLNKVLQSSPPTCVVCQYDTRAFRGDTLLATLRVHPLVLVESRILPNPFFEPESGSTSH
jgi:hypothetical protein